MRRRRSLLAYAHRYRLPCQKSALLLQASVLQAASPHLHRQPRLSSARKLLLRRRGPSSTSLFTRENARTSRALGCCARCSGPSARRKRASAKFSPRATSRAAVVTPEDKENAPAPFSAEVAAAPFSAELTAGAFDDYGDCKQS